MPTAPSAIRTERLLLRRWRAGDRAAFAAMNADPRVMEHFPGTLSRHQSDALVERIELGFEEHGFGLWAVEVVGGEPFIGFVGLSLPRFQAPFMPAVEVGWRLAAESWGRGYATEAARAALDDGFRRVGLEETVSFTSPRNVRSIAVMQRLGMTRDPGGDFDHPNLPEGHPIRRHVLHRLRRP